MSGNDKKADYDNNADAYRRWSVADNVYWLVEQTRYFEVLGSVRDLNILDLACGEGRISRILMRQGARSVLGTDISVEMIERAEAQNKTKDGRLVYPALRYEVVDACSETFTLDHPVDLVTAMYLFHYAPNEDALNQMCRHVSRNLKPGGRFVVYTINPECDFSRLDPDLLKKTFGFYYRVVAPPHYELVFDKLTVNMWHWGKATHEEGLERAGLTNIQWHSLCLPASHNELARSLKWYMDNPSCIVLSADKPS
ncbi:MAG: class I SAM-dependent methyltransferase [Arenicellales bacterium]|nr:class I SAM-dependent methyltransferase [Arenicellales bacterium]